MDASLEAVKKLKNKLDSNQNKHDYNYIKEIDADLANLESLRTEIKTPTKPPKLVYMKRDIEIIVINTMNSLRIY